MGKQERDENHRHREHREKSHKRHKHHKSSRHRHSEIVSLNQKKKPTNIMEEDIEIEVGYESQMPSQVPANATPTTAINVEEEENVDIEADDLGLETSMETSKEMLAEEEQPAVVEKVKKPAKKPEPIVNTSTTKPTTSSSPSTNSNIKKSKKRRGSGTSSEEERWLTAIESGKLEQVEDVEMRKMKDPKLMTARQRAMYDRNNDTECAPGFSETLIALPTGYKEKEKPQTAEEIQKAVLKSQKRKQQADEKREKDKKKTMERLLKKQESKNKSTAKPKSAKDGQPVISYKNTVEGAFINLPVGVEFPLKAQMAKEPPARQLCGIPGCGQAKVYNCSKTNVPLCSLECYRKNVQSSKNIIC